MGKKSKPSVLEFRIVGLIPGPIFFMDRKWDLSNISEQDAEILIQNGCPYVEWVTEENKDISSGKGMIQ